MKTTESQKPEPTAPSKPMNLFGYTSEEELFAAFNRRKKAVQKRIKG